MYAEMPPAEKESWAARAEADKERYLHELSSYVPPPGYDAKGDSIITDTEYGAAKPTKRYGKVERDPNAPKRNISAYLLYQHALRNSYKRILACHLVNLPSIHLACARISLLKRKL